MSLTEIVGQKICDGVRKTEELFSSAWIYRVPEELRKLKESAYTPRLISIGPLHSEDEHLKSSMQDVKLWYVNFLICRMTGGSEELKFTVLEECLKTMKLSLEDAKKSYAEKVDNLNEEMLVVDGCFILELLYRYHLLNNPPKKTNEGSKEDPKKTNKESEEVTTETPKETISDPFFASRLMRITVQHDLLLLENQLPFCVLEKLFLITVAKIPNRPHNFSLFDYVIEYFRKMTSPEPEVKSATSNATNCCLPGECVLPLFGNRMDSENKGVAAPKKSKEMYYHILHMLHDHCLPRDPPEREDYSGCDPPKGEDYSELMPSASNLAYAGVKFVADTGENLFKVNFTEAKSCPGRCFHRAPFEISTLSLNDSTEVFLRNLIAFEQCCPGVSGYFTSYAFLMDKLVDSEKDVEVLRKAGIIRNNLGADKEASDLFNNLCKEVVLGKFHFTKICNQATQYSKRCWPAAVAHVRRQYFATPWTFIAFCIAFIAFGMSVTQFIRSFLK
ncbi:UPF0481 protein At3g47200-like [Actinidia eriantha]|uniref:UPF0481 protein At3g47200-like n=1 Tax=Actinidia eriantha TaxID=165200 RepID=UPI00258B209B|nr:UPF0481 protein At3g47200-like [Actinidia eriantha]